MVMAGASKAGRGQSDRAKTSKSVRLDDRRGFDHKFNKTGFKCEAQRNLYHYYLKCYEQVLRCKAASTVLSKRDFAKYGGLALKPLPGGFNSLKKLEKIEILNKLVEEQVDAGIAIVQQCQVNRLGKMEVVEGRSAELGPEYSISEASSFDGDALQSVPRNSQGDSQGRRPTCLDYVENFHQCVSELKLRASRDSDILREVEEWEQKGMQLMMKLKDRDICNSLQVDSTSTLLRSRQEEILAQLQEDIMAKDPPSHCGKPLMERVGLQASYSQASNFGTDVERGAEMFASTTTHMKQDPAIDPISTASSLIIPPVRSISEALNVTPSCTGRLKTNLEEIHPRVAGDLQYQFSKPTMEAFGPSLSHPQANDTWGNQQICSGEHLAPIPHSGGSSASQMFPFGDSIPIEPSTLEQATLEFLAEKSWNEQVVLEGSPSSSWSHYWPSPVHYE